MICHYTIHGIIQTGKGVKKYITGNRRINIYDNEGETAIT
jgi:hypothetical protein